MGKYPDIYLAEGSIIWEVSLHNLFEQTPTLEAFVA